MRSLQELLHGYRARHPQRNNIEAAVALRETKKFFARHVQKNLLQSIHPKKIQGGVLYIAVDHPSLIQELKMLERQLFAALKNQGVEHVDALRVYVRSY